MSIQSIGHGDGNYEAVCVFVQFTSLVALTTLLKMSRRVNILNMDKAYSC